MSETKFRAFRRAYETVGGLKIPASMWWFDIRWGNFGHGVGWIGMLPLGETDTRKREQRDPDDHIIMQYTGLKDRAGEEVFEGDIVNDGFVAKEVVFRQGSWQLKRDYSFIEEGKRHEGTHYSDLWMWVKDYNGITIIGNVYQNPELLKEQLR